MDEENLTSESKIAFAIQKANTRLLKFNKILVSVSGGADSDVMLDLLLRVCPKEKLHFVFFNTGIEYEATMRHLEFLETKYDIKIERPHSDMPVPLAVKKYGLPFISKDISVKINSLQNNNFDFANDGWKSYDELVEKYPHCKSALQWWCNTKKGFNISSTAYLKDFLISYPPPRSK